MKKNTNIPADCRPRSELAAWEIMYLWLPSFRVHHDSCQEYYEHVMLDPLLTVTPTVVLSDMLAGFLLHPVGMLGTAVADYSKNILGEMYSFSL
jgi:hypothetical protein